jgi:hypothetical protein
MQRDARAYGGAVAGSAAFLAVLGRFFEARLGLPKLGTPEKGKSVAAQLVSAIKAR